MITIHKEYIEIKLQDTNNNWYLYSSSSATQRFQAFPSQPIYKLSRDV